VNRWTMGDKDHMVEFIFHFWAHYNRQQAELIRRKLVTQQCVVRALADKDTAIVLLVFSDWAAERRNAIFDQNEAHEAERQQRLWEEREMQALENHQRQMSATRADLVMRAWARGTKGLCSGFLHDWWLVVQSGKRESRRHQAVQATVNRFLLGDQRGCCLTSFKAWSNWSETEKIHRMLQDRRSNIVMRTFRLSSTARLFTDWVTVVERRREEELAARLQAEATRMAHQIHHAELQRRELQSMGAHHLWSTNMTIFSMEIFLAWRLVAEDAMTWRQGQQKAKALANEWMLRYHQKNQEVLQQYCFDLWLSQAMEELSIRRLEAEIRKKYAGTIEAIQARNSHLDKQVQFLLSHVTDVTEALQEELITKTHVTKNLDMVSNTLDDINAHSCLSTERLLQPECIDVV